MEERGYMLGVAKAVAGGAVGAQWLSTYNRVGG